MSDRADEQFERVLGHLRGHGDTIAGAASRQPPVRFVATTWGRWVAETDIAPACGAVLECLSDNVISRADLAAAALEADTDDGRLRLLIATLIWGRGTSNGRMRRHMVGALVHPDRSKVLATTQHLVLDGDLAAAYRAWSLPGLREPFFTKWLWAAGLTAEPGRRGLILDGRVWRSLGALGWSSIEAANGSRLRRDRYAAYVDSARGWAHELSSPDLSVSAEDVEFALFAANGELASSS